VCEVELLGLNPIGLKVRSNENHWEILGCVLGKKPGVMKVALKLLQRCCRLMVGNLRSGEVHELEQQRGDGGETGRRVDGRWAEGGILKE
jgi:hypothetical protein